MVDPATMAAIISAIGSTVGGAAQGAAQGQSGIVNREQAMELLNQIFRQQNLFGLQGMALPGLGGASFKAGGIVTGKANRRKNMDAALEAFVKKSEGLEGAELKDRMNALRSGNLNKNKEFKEFLKTNGEQFQLKVKGGKIKGIRELVSPTLDLGEAGKLSEDIIGLNRGIAAENVRGIGRRKKLGSMLDETLGAGPVSIEEGDQAALDKLKQAELGDLKRFQTGLFQEALGSFQGRGIRGGSLMADTIANRVGGKMSQEFDRFTGNQFLRGEQLLTGRQNRRSSRVSNLTRGIGSTRQAFFNPSQAGAFTAPQIASFMQQAGQNLDQRLDRSNQIDIMTSPDQDRGGFF
jgi:hypothetical protein